MKTPDFTTEPLPKRWAILRLVAGLVDVGVSIDVIRTVLPASKTVRVQGVYTDPHDLWKALQMQHDKPDPKRWHLADPIVVSDQSCVHSNWAKGTRGFFKALLALAPEGFAVYEEGEVPESLD